MQFFNEYETILKIFFFIVFTIVCLGQCYSILREFLEYPAIIDLYEVSPSLVSILPGLTICNNNRFSIRKLVNRNETFRRRYMEKFPQLFKKEMTFFDRPDFRAYRDELSELFDSLNYKPPSDTADAPMNHWFELRPSSSSFIEWLGCAQTWSNSMNCNRLTRIDSVTNRICTTLLHKGAMLNDYTRRPDLFDESKIRDNDRGHSKLKSSAYFDTKEVIKMIVNFEPEDYGDLGRQIGARIVFHDNTHVASTGDLDFFITRGFRYDFSIDRIDAKLVGQPYGSCWNYENENLNQYKERVEPRVPLGERTCYQNCVVRNVLRRSKCWPQSMPYFRNDSLDPDLGVRPCGWLRNSQHFSLAKLIQVDNYKSEIRLQSVNASHSSNATNEREETPPPMHERMSTYHKIRRFCWSQCILSCNIVTYSVTVTRSDWPSNVNVMFDKSGYERDRRHCCALVAIKYLHFHHNVNEYKPKFDLANTIGDVGGLLAFWLGLSIVSIYNALQKLARLCSGSASGSLGSAEVRPPSLPAVPVAALERRNKARKRIQFSGHMIKAAEICTNETCR